MQKREIEVVAGVFVEGDRISLFRRNANDSWPDYWEFPGGKVESMENKTDALIREIQEELGVDCQILKDFGTRSHEYPQALVHLNLFLIQVPNYNFELVDHSEWNFFSLEEVKALEVAPADIPFLTELENWMSSRQ